MAYHNLTLASATLSNGALLASSGGGMPQRITPPAPVFYDYFAAHAAATTNVLLCTNGTDIIVTSTGIIKKITFDSAGAATVAWSSSASGINGIFRKDSNTIIGARSTSTAGFYEINETTGVVTSRTFTGTNATAVRRRIIWDGSAYWSYEATSTIRKFDSSFAEVTGTTIALSGTPSQVDYSAGDGVGGIYVMGAVASTVQKYKVSDQSLEKTWTWTPTTSQNVPGMCNYIEMCLNATGVPICRSQSSGAIDIFPVCSGSSVTVDKTNATRLVYPGPDIRGATLPATGGGAQQRPGMDISSTRLAFSTSGLTQLQVYGAVRTIPIVAARAKWTYTADSSEPITGIEVPGHLGDLYGPSSGYLTSDPIQDFRHTRLYYQRIGTDGALVEFTQGTPISFTPSNGMAIDVVADLLGVYTMPGGPVPYVGGDGGEGPRIAYTAGSNIVPTVSIANIGKRIQLPTSSSSFTATATDSDGSIASYAWTQTSGPNTATLGGTTTATLSVSGCIAGTYVFHLVVTDNSGGTCTEDVELVVAAALANVIPTVSDAAQTVQLPTATTTITATAADADGSISTYAWTRVSGPNTPTLSGTATATLTIGATGTPMVYGTYVYRCTVTDNSGGTATVDAKIFVLKEPVVVEAGPSQKITLPTTSATITPTITSGAIASAFFRLNSGPNTPGGGMGAGPTYIVTLTDLVEGTYDCQYEFTDIYGTVWTTKIQVFVVAQLGPTVYVGDAGKTIQLPTTSSFFVAVADDPDGTIASYLWVQQSGPVFCFLENADTSVVTISEATAAGDYDFMCTVTDNDGATAVAYARLVVLEAAAVRAPVVYGADIGKTIELGDTAFFYVNAFDSAGNFASLLLTYAWAQDSGPAATLGVTDQATLSVLEAPEAGTYQFSCTVTDASTGLQGFATVLLWVVDPAPIQYIPLEGGEFTVDIEPEASIDVDVLEVP